MAGASKFTNRDRLRRKMKAIPVEVRRALRAQNKANAEDMVATAKGFAETSRETGALIASIRSRDVSDSTRITARVSAGSKEAHYARFVEFGTAASEAHAATPARPFFWPAWRLLRRRFKSRMSRAAKKAIQGAVK